MANWLVPSNAFVQATAFSFMRSVPLSLPCCAHMSTTNDLIHIQNFVNGQFKDADSGEWLDNYEPATGKVFSKVASSDASDVETAYLAAKAAFPAWKKTPAEARSKILHRIAEVLTSRLVRNRRFSRLFAFKLKIQESNRCNTVLG